MRRKSHATDLSSQEVVKDIRRATRSAEEKRQTRAGCKNRFHINL